MVLSPVLVMTSTVLTMESESRDSLEQDYQLVMESNKLERERRDSLEDEAISVTIDTYRVMQDEEIAR